jgi:hypothetical protein
MHDSPRPERLGGTILDLHDSIVTALRQHGRPVLVAATGSGETTQVPANAARCRACRWKAHPVLHLNAATADAPGLNRQALSKETF